jgi:ribonuclease HI
MVSRYYLPLVAMVKPTPSVLVAERILTALVWVLFMLIECSCLILHFDGSFHKHSGVASCAAAIFLDDGTTLVGLGGSQIESSSLVTTSAEIEYEGLILGLRWLLLLQNQHQSVKATQSLTIRGDCLTIINQLRGTSRPRKLESKYREASILLQQLIAVHQAYHNPIIEWVPRSLPQQMVTDWTANELITIIQELEMQMLELPQGLTNFEGELPISLQPTLDMLTTSTAKKKIHFMRYHLLIHNLIYQAYSNNEYSILIKIEQFLCEEINRLSKRTSTKDALRMLRRQAQKIMKGMKNKTGKLQFKNNSLQRSFHLTNMGSNFTNTIPLDAASRKEAEKEDLLLSPWRSKLDQWKSKSQSAPSNILSYNSVWLHFPPFCATDQRSTSAA